MKQTTEVGYAKINLSLDVTAKRPDGYHEIDGIMQSISLADQIDVQVTPADALSIRLTAVGNPDMPTDERNLAVRAAARFAQEIGLSAEINIRLEKHIPMAGGLAGGSADAAAVLRALNRLYEYPMSQEALCAIGSKLGADVPFCIMGGCMRTEGIGDRLTPCSSLPDCTIVIARRGEGVSTPWAYGRLDELYQNFSESASRPQSELPQLIAALDAQDLRAACAHVFNLFEAPVSECRPDVSALCGTMLEGGALAAHMSGSGPSVFGIFDNPTSGESACRYLRSLGAEAYVCTPVSAKNSLR